MGATLGRFSRATRLYAAADQLIEADREIIAMPEDREEYKRDIAHVRDRLGEAEFAAAWAAGRAMSLEEAIAYALAATGPLATAPTVA